MDERLPELVQRAFGGEVLGVELFGRLAAAEDDDGRRERLLAVQRLEAQTKDAAAQLAADLGVDVVESESDREAGRRAADFLATLEWPERMRAVAAATGNYRELYAELAGVVPDPAHPCVVALVDHERALNDFATGEAEGDDNAYDRLRSVLVDVEP